MSRLDRTYFRTGPANVYRRERLTGTVTTAGTDAIVGAATLFTTELVVGDVIIIEGETLPLVVEAITDATHLTTVTAAATSASGKTIDADINLGYLDEGLEVSSDAGDSIEMKGAQAGTTILGRVLSGLGKTIVKCEMKQISVENIKRAFPNSGAVTISTTKKGIAIKPRPGYDMVTYSKPLVVKPILAGTETTDKNKWVFAPLAHPTGAGFSLSFNNTDQQKFTAEFECFPDIANATEADVTLIFGDPTLWGYVV